MKIREVMGVDVGGSGIKGAPVDTKKGILLDDRHRIPTPEESKPEKISKIIKELIDHFNWKGPIGIGFPAVVQQGVVKTASNIDKSWIGVNAADLFAKETDCPVYLVNDADAAAIAEMKFGAGKNNKGLVLLMTVGTGIGTVLYTKKKLVPNMELGHVILPNGKEAEAYCSDGVRKELDLSWEDWGKRFNEYLVYMEALLRPDLIIIGGGLSKKMHKFEDVITIKTPIEPAKLLNEAGLIGAAVGARKTFKKLY